MLNIETKRRIDSARDILVGKVPDPKAQVEQITTAMIYKFMDDMDKEAQEIGGKSKFFTNGYEKYSWTNIMDSKLGGQERLNLYGEAIIKMQNNPHIPQLFRDIFKDAFLPYRSPETLSLFLKEINGFKYLHSEDLGDAFEYLLSILGSQGDAGQFRTPRHIIDFIVSVVDPKKDETILDPACGTAGFLISSYKHIVAENKDKLNPDDKKRMMNHIVGYDISPDMVKLSKVNMYLHGFPTPHIFEYDTLSSEDKWEETYDVIMANPPFMTPKGGIKPHKRFSVQANRAEVLFVNYIMEHLNINGRAGIIVPEGIIFQSANAYKQLRKLLVDENYLWAVVSLPAGVFQPYSGVKTSILFLDRQLAKVSDSILFVKVDNDGYDLGAQRRKIEKDDLPIAKMLLDSYKRNIAANNTPKTEELEKLTEKTISIFVPKTKIKNIEDYYLTGDRYKEINQYKNQKWPRVEINEISEVSAGNSAPQDRKLFKNGKFPFFRTSDVGIVHISDNLTNSKDKLNEFGIRGLRLFQRNTILFPKSGASTFLNHRVLMGVDGYVSSHLATIIPNDKKVLPLFLFYLLLRIDARTLTNNQNYPSLRTSDIAKIKIPLPPLEVQKEIVDEVNRYQKIIDGAKQVIKNWRPIFNIDNCWGKINFGKDNEIQIIDGDRGINYPKKEEFKKEGYCLFLNTSNVKNGYFDFSECDFISKERDSMLRKGKLKKGDIVLTTRGTVGNTAYYSNDITFENIRINSGMVILRTNPNLISHPFLLLFLNSIHFQEQVNRFLSGSAQPQLPIRVLSHITIPMPELNIQKQIVEKIEIERKIVDANKRIVEIFEKKIKEKINEVYQS